MEPTLNTPGVIARILGIPIHRVQYILRTRTYIRPAARAGGLRLFNEQAVREIQIINDSITQRTSNVPTVAGRIGA